MAYLGTIVRHLETAFHVKVHGQFHARTEIEGTRFLTPEQETDPEYGDKLLYVACSMTGTTAGRPQAAVPGWDPQAASCLDSQAASCLDSQAAAPGWDSQAAAPFRRLPNILLTGHDTPPDNPGILYIREALDACQVFNAIQEVIFRHYTLKLKQEELFQSLHSDNGIAGMAHVAHTFLGNPVTICDTSFSVIAASPVVKDADNLEERHGRLYLKDSLFQNMADQNIIRHIYSSAVPYLTALDDYSYQWVFESIRIHHAVVGYICVRGTVREFTEDDLEFIDVFSKMLSIEMQKDSSYRHPTGLKYEYFLTELLEGHFDRAGYIASRLIQLGRAQMPYYTILLLKFTEPSRKPRPYKGYFEQLLSLLPNCMVAVFHGDLTVLLPSGSGKPFCETGRNRFAAFLQLNRMQAYVSYPYTDIAKSSIYWRQVKELSLLHEKTGLPKDRHFIYYEQYYLEHGFCQYKDTGLLAASVHPVITQMTEYDRTANTEYTRTLRIYLVKNRNALAAAGELHIHKSTFFYRLGKMADLFGIDMNDGLALFSYEYSFRVLDYLGLGSV